MSGYRPGIKIRYYRHKLSILRIYLNFPLTKIEKPTLKTVFSLESVNFMIRRHLQSFIVVFIRKKTKFSIPFI